MLYRQKHFTRKDELFAQQISVRILTGFILILRRKKDTIPLKQHDRLAVCYGDAMCFM
jgi:hypothetical protein